MADVARASLTRLVQHTLERSQPSVPSKAPAGGDPVRSAFVPAGDKRRALELLWRHAGPEAVLAVGRNVRDISFDPIWRVALNLGNPSRLYAGWRRLENYGHSRNRLRIIETAADRTDFERYSTDPGNTPTDAENLLICGLIIGLLEGIGCRGLVCTMAAKEGKPRTIYGDGKTNLPADVARLATGAWTIGWEAVEARPHSPYTATDDIALPLPDSCRGTARAAVMKTVRLMAGDLLRPWAVADIACTIGLSTRTYQRRLRDAGLSFSVLVRAVRVHEACRLLTDTDITITAAGFCAGFCDSAHFSRDFRASLGMTPSAYRAAIRE